MTLTLGIDRLLTSENSRLEGRRIGVVSNPTSVDRAFRHSVDRLASHPNAQVTALFGPQHGFHSDAQDNMIETPHAQDVRHGVPVYSLYSETREPTAEMLADVDVLVVDLQDVGTRVYTYIYTMANCLVSAARHGVDVIVCDRPNPIGGTAVEGPRLVPAFRSFVGQFPIPLRHGMTIGELARLFNEEYGLGASLEVVSMDGWDRSMYHDETGLPWVIPSPNIPTLDTAIVYPGGVLFEGTNVSEGRGTTRPFELIGAPWIDPYRLTAEFERAGLPGVHVRPVWFEPTFHKHAGTACGGCQLHVLDRGVFRPVATAVALMQAMRAQARDRFSWRAPPYEYEHVKTPIDILAGSDRLRQHIEADAPLAAIVEDWDADRADFLGLRAQYLLY